MSIRVTGHARKIDAANVRTQGMYSTCSGYVARCSCGWTAWETPVKSGAISLHDEHKADVVSGDYAKMVAAETARRLAAYDGLLADEAKIASLSLTVDQVTGWREEITSGRTIIFVPMAKNSGGFRTDKDILAGAA